MAIRAAIELWSVSWAEVAAGLLRRYATRTPTIGRHAGTQRERKKPMIASGREHTLRWVAIRDRLSRVARLSGWLLKSLSGSFLAFSPSLNSTALMASRAIFSTHARLLLLQNLYLPYAILISRHQEL